MPFATKAMFVTSDLINMLFLPQSDVVMNSHK